MEKQHCGNSLPENKIFEIKDGQRIPLCCNMGKGRCPSLIYKQSETSVNVEGAFAILFDKLFKKQK